jgi:hypothetical protein
VTKQAGGSSSSVSKASYIAKADAICSSYFPRIQRAIHAKQRAQASGNLHHFKQDLADFVSASGQTLTRLEQLPRPSDDAATLTQMFDKWDQGQSLASNELQSVQNGDMAGASALRNQSNSALEQGNGIATAYGFKVCNH